MNALDAERLEIEKRQQGTVALQEKQKELESKFEALKRDTKEADENVDALDEDIDAETKEKNRLQAEKNKVCSLKHAQITSTKSPLCKLSQQLLGDFHEG